MKETINNWITEKLAVANELYAEAEEAREKSEYTDITALEQSEYNSGVIDILAELRTLLQNIKD